MATSFPIILIASLLRKASALFCGKFFPSTNSKRWILFCHNQNLYLAVLFAMLLGWATNCLPAALPARLALVVAAYSAEDNDFIAASGRYRSPVFDEGLPDLVRHF